MASASMKHEARWDESPASPACGRNEKTDRPRIWRYLLSEVMLAHR